MNKNKLLTYALNAENKLVNVNDVPNGLECNCRCPRCKESLIAKKDGRIRIHHFAHKSDSECVHGYQTMIHLLAKEIILETRVVPLLFNSNYLSAIEIFKEIPIHELGIIPDILGFSTITYGTRIVRKFPVIVEIYVTHRVDDKKAEIIRNAGIPAVEIDLSNTNATTKEELFAEIYNPKNWRIINETLGDKFKPNISLRIPSYTRSPHRRRGRLS